MIKWLYKKGPCSPYVGDHTVAKVFIILLFKFYVLFGTVSCWVEFGLFGAGYLFVWFGSGFSPYIIAGDCLLPLHLYVLSCIIWFFLVLIKLPSCHLIKRKDKWENVQIFERSVIPLCKKWYFCCNLASPWSSKVRIILSSSIFPILVSFLLLESYSYSERVAVKRSLYLLPWKKRHWGLANDERMESWKKCVCAVGLWNRLRRAVMETTVRSFEVRWQRKFRKAEIVLLTGHPPIFLRELEIYLKYFKYEWKGQGVLNNMGAPCILQNKNRLFEPV